MSLSSSSSNASLPPLGLYELIKVCLTNRPGSYSVTAYTITNILLILPLCIVVLHLAKQRWQQQIKMSHSEFFIYNMAVIQLIGVLASVLGCVSVYIVDSLMSVLTICLLFFTGSGQIIFQILTCLDRYLAAVHPVTYLNLKTRRWTRIRNIGTSCVWLLCFAQIGSMSIVHEGTETNIYTLCFFVFAIILIIYCNLAVLCTLIRPGPGDGGLDKRRANQSKRRAFYTITGIMGSLLLKFGWDLLSYLIIASVNSLSVMCNLWLAEVWFSLPSTVVLPLMFLHRAGKHSCFKKKQ